MRAALRLTHLGDEICIQTTQNSSVNLLNVLASCHQYRMKELLVLPIAFILLFGTPAFATIAQGLEAAESGDYTTSLKAWKLLAVQGDADAQFNLGVLYMQGLGVTPNYRVANKWFKLAAEQGDAKAQVGLGVMYIKGWGVVQDYRAAFKWFKKAAEQGRVEAQGIVSNMYEEGLGVRQDYTRAHMWGKIAASHGGNNAVEYLRIVERKMSPADLLKAQKLARECVAKNFKDC